MLEVKGLNCGYKNNIILRDVSFTAKSGDIVCILGPNGSGKSTLIKTILGLLNSKGGQILIDKQDIRDWSWRDRARIISYIPQVFSSTFEYRSIDIVLMGRTSHLGFGASPSSRDERIAEEAMEKLKILHLRDRIYSKLSGGERQLVKIAQSLAQESKIILMDEPTNNLDFGNQITMLKHLQECVNMGLIIIMVTHFPEQAFLYGTRALLIKNGVAKEINEPNDNLTVEILNSLYEVDMRIVELGGLEETKRKICLPIF